MKNHVVTRFLLICFAVNWFGREVHAQSGHASPPTLFPDRGSLRELELDQDRQLRVTFATPMVDLDFVHRTGRPCPILFTPTVETDWMWMSQLEGRLKVLNDYGAAVPGVTCRAKLRPGLRDLAGNPVGSEKWAIEFSEPAFELIDVGFVNADEGRGNRDADPRLDTEDHPSAAAPADYAKLFGRDEDDALPAHPRVRLEFSKDISPADLKKCVYFLDRQRDIRYPVEVNLEGKQKLAPQGWCFVEPIDALPAGFSYDLILENVREARAGGGALPSPIVIPTGKTHHPKILDVRGYNQPRKGAFFRVAAEQSFEATEENLDHLAITPPVSDLKITPTGSGFEATGHFDPTLEYEIALKAGLTSHDGFPLPEDSTWHIKFGSKRPAVIFENELSYQLASTGLVQVPFTQVNTQKLTWKLARIPSDELEDIRTRLREFGDFDYFNKNPLYNSKTGENIFHSTTLLLDETRAGQMEILAKGEIEPSLGDVETERVIKWKAPDQLPDTLLLEVSGLDSQNRIVGNRIIISRTDWLMGVICETGDWTLRFYNISDGKPVEGLRVECLGEKSFEKTTDANGELKTDGVDPYAYEILAGPEDRQSLHDPALPVFSSRGSPDESWEQGETVVLVTDRNVYAPGEVVYIKGYIRGFEKGKLTIPKDWDEPLTISSSADPHEETIDVKLSDRGTISARWPIPEGAYGAYKIQMGLGSAEIKVSEFRRPPFSVVVEAPKTTGPEAVATVSSMLYHGDPNHGARVRWKAEWIADNWDDEDEDVYENENDRFYMKDLFSPDSPDQGLSGQTLRALAEAGWDIAKEDRDVNVSAVVVGEKDLVTDQSGNAVIKCKCPLISSPYARFRVFWIVDVTSSVTAQMVRGGTVSQVQRIPQVLAAKLGETGTRNLSLNVISEDADNQQGSGVEVKAELFSLEVKTAKEQLSPGFQRYVNTPIFTKVWEGTMITPGEKDIHVAEGGSYVVRVTVPKEPEIPQVSASAVAAADDDEVHLAVGSESTLQVVAEKARYDVGEEMLITVKSPALGRAFLSVERDRVLYKEQVELKGNISKFRVKAVPAFSPNVWVTVNLIAPGANKTLPGERFGACPVRIDLPEHRLDTKVILEKSPLEPGAMVRGTVNVSQGGVPLKNADVLLFAVDESVLALGKWSLPDFNKAFFPNQPWNVLTRSSISPDWHIVEPIKLQHSQKGFILGDVPELITQTYFRREFQALADWKEDLRTNAKGEVAFQFKAPESLTTYRVLAVTQQGTDKFGQGQAALRLSKQLQVEPVLPSFLRQGDTVMLRTSVRQNYADSDSVEVAVKTDRSIKVEGPLTKTVTLRRNEPMVVDFKARAAETAKHTLVKFAAGSRTHKDIRDGEEREFDIHPSVVERVSTFTKTFGRMDSIDIQRAIDPVWAKADGTCDILFSGSSFLPKLAGISDMLEAQGTSEKFATRILTVTLLTQAAAFLPISDLDKSRLKEKVKEALKQLGESELREGGFAKWPNSQRDANIRDDFATIEGAWAIRNASKMYPDLVSGVMLERSSRTLLRIINAEIGFDDVSPAARCYALMAYCASLTAEDNSETESLQSAMDTFFEKRDEKQQENPALPILSLQDRAWLALSMHYLNVFPDKRQKLLDELDGPVDPSTLNASLLDSQLRVEAIRLFARSELLPTTASPQVRQPLVQAFEKIANSSLDLSTQENLWLLMLFNSLLQGQTPAKIARNLTPKPPQTSLNQISAGWLRLPLSQLATTFPKPVQPKVMGSYLFRAKYKAIGAAAPEFNPQFKILRRAENKTAPKRNGTPEAPWKAGDQILITYQITTEGPHSHLEFEDLLPGCLEVVNPDLPAIDEKFPTSIEAGVNRLKLSHRSLRLDRTLLYFEDAPPGISTYGVLARVIVPGTYSWPSTQVRALYDQRFHAYSDTNDVQVSQ